jgi:hypothetical protein
LLVHEVKASFIFHLSSLLFLFFTPLPRTHIIRPAKGLTDCLLAHQPCPTIHQIPDSRFYLNLYRPYILHLALGERKKYKAKSNTNRSPPPSHSTLPPSTPCLSSRLHPTTLHYIHGDSRVIICSCRQAASCCVLLVFRWP